MKSLIGIVVIGLAVGGVFYLNGAVRNQAGQSMLNIAPRVQMFVETAKPERGEITRTVQAPGEVEPLDEVDISSEVVAKILEMPVEEGDLVHQGDLLCRLDDADYQARLRSSQANLEKLKALQIQAEADLEFAEADWAEAQNLLEKGSIAVQDHANYRTSLVRARAVLSMRKQEIIEAEALLESAQQDLARTVITAPITGVVSQLFAEQGEVVITGTMNNPGTRIMVISDLSKMQVRCRVDEADAPLVEAGQVARIFLQSDTHRSIAGEVLRVGTKGTKPVGRDVVTFETLVLITGDDPRVRPGMTANVEIEVAHRDDVLTVPVEAVVYRRRRDLPKEITDAYDARQREINASERQTTAEYIRLIFTVSDGIAHSRLVEVGINDIKRVEITEGLMEDDTVVIGPYRSLDQLKDGSPITLTMPGVVPGAGAAPTTQPTSAPTTAPADDTEPPTADDGAPNTDDAE